MSLPLARVGAKGEHDGLDGELAEPVVGRAQGEDGVVFDGGGAVFPRDAEEVVVEVVEAAGRFFFLKEDAGEVSPGDLWGVERGDVAGDVVGVCAGICGDPLTTADDVALHGLRPAGFAGLACVCGVSLDPGEVPGTGKIAVMLWPFEPIEAEMLGVAALGTRHMEAMLAPGEELRPDRAGLDGGRGGEAGFRDAAVEIQTRHGELERGGLEGGVVWPFVDLIGEEVADRAGSEVPFGASPDELERAGREVHLGLAEIVVVCRKEVLERPARAEAGMKLPLGPGLGVVVGRGDIEDRAGVFADGPHEAVGQPGRASDLSGLYKSELPDFRIREPKVELPEVGSIVGIVTAGARGESLVEVDIFLSPLERGRTSARIPDAVELLLKLFKQRGHRGVCLWRRGGSHRPRRGFFRRCLRPMQGAWRSAGQEDWPPQQRWPPSIGL